MGTVQEHTPESYELRGKSLELLKAVVSRGLPSNKTLVGIPVKEETLEKERTEKSYSVDLESITGATVPYLEEKQRIVPEELTAHTGIAGYTRGFRSIKRAALVKTVKELLEELSKCYMKPEAAVYLDQIKASLKEMWEFIYDEDKEVAFIITGIENTLREARWKTLTPHQIKTLARALDYPLRDGLDQKVVNKVISMLTRSGAEIFPSATIKDEKNEEKKS